jgi:hypothetical protein
MIFLNAGSDNRLSPQSVRQLAEAVAVLREVDN